MFEARLAQAEVLKKVLEAVKELVTDANFECSDEGIKLQAMDNSHVALVSLQLNSAGFEQFRCDRNISLGMSIASLQKIVKCAANDDVVTLRADESQDVLGLLFENKNTDRVGEYEMKLMDIDQEHLGIPDTVYDAEVTLPAAEFARIIRDLKELGESVKIEVSKDGVRFSADGDIGSASVTLKPSAVAAEEDAESEDEDEAKGESEDEDEDDDVIVEDADIKKVKKEKKPVISDDEEEEEEKPAVTQDGDDDDGDVEIQEVKKEKKPVIKKRAASDSPVKKGKKPAAKKSKAEPKKREKKEVVEPPRKVTIHLQQAVNSTFSIKYLSNFAKSTPLSEYVHLHMTNEVPLLVEYPFAAGHIRYYLAPKISEEEG